MLGLLLPALFQAAAGAPAAAPPTEVTITAVKPATDEAPKEVCKMVPVTGSRTIKQRVCKTQTTERVADAERDRVKEFLTTNGNTQQPSLSGP